jgi:lipoyl(octanoyl) transferase
MKIRDLGVQAYQPTLESMRDFTVSRDADTEDELWLLEHPPVFTQGANGRAEHILNVGDIDIVQTDRGGQVTYHGPGQLVAYPLIDLRRIHCTVRQMVTHLEQTVIRMLSDHAITAYARQDAPGVYVDEAKIAALGLRVKRGACYHGVSFNIDMELTPFSLINPCGYAGMEVIDLKGLGISVDMAEAKQHFATAFNEQLLLGKQA